MKPKAILILAGVLLFVGLGLYLGLTEGIEPGMASCSKYSLICRR